MNKPTRDEILSSTSLDESGWISTFRSQQKPYRFRSTVLP